MKKDFFEETGRIEGRSLLKYIKETPARVQGKQSKAKQTKERESLRDEKGKKDKAMKKYYVSYSYWHCQPKVNMPGKQPLVYSKITESINRLFS